jgi:hypothetical protein
MAPSVTPNRTDVRIYRRGRRYPRCRIDRIFINHHRRRRYNDRRANHDGLGNDGSRLLDNDRRRSPVLVCVKFTLIAWNFAIGSYRQIGGHSRRGKS